MDKWSWTVDRLEGEWAVLEVEPGRAMDIPRSTLPEGLEEGDVLKISVSRERESASWTLERDEAATKERRSKIEELREELKRRDPGGDIVL